MTWGLRRGFIYHFYGETSSCWETFNMVIIRDRPLVFFWGGGVGLGNCLGHDIFFSPLGCALFFFWWAKGYAPLAHFFQRFLLSRIFGGVIA